MSESDKTGSGKADADKTSAASSPSGAATSSAQPVTAPVVPADDPPERPTPPDVAVGGGIHRPGHAPGVTVLDGPAAMTVGAHRRGTKKK